MEKRGKFAIILFSLILMTSLYVSASSYCATAEVSDISPSSVGIDEEFTVGIHVENCGDKSPEYVSFELIDPPTDIIIKEPFVINISNLYYGNSERFITYHMRTTTDAKPSTHIIKTRLHYGDAGFSITKDYNITIDVLGNKAQLNIASAKTDPVIPREGDTVELTLRIENFGKGDANSIKVGADHDFEGAKEAFIGTLESDEDGPAVFVFVTRKAGEFEFPVNIYYEDDFGEHQTQLGLKVMILKKRTNWFNILLFVFILAMIIAFVFYYFKTKEEKEKIVEQILKSNNKEIKKEKKNKSLKKK